jgi:hypothetical protein
MKLTEDKTIELLINYLMNDGYNIISHCLGQNRGYDIVAEKMGKKLIVEVKGAKAGDNSPTKRRDKFDSGQIKTHFGKALVKVMETKKSFPNDIVAIAHPYDEDIIKSIGDLIPELEKLNIIHFWVKNDGLVLTKLL